MVQFSHLEVSSVVLQKSCNQIAFDFRPAFVRGLFRITPHFRFCGCISGFHFAQAYLGSVDSRKVSHRNHGDDAQAQEHDEEIWDEEEVHATHDAKEEVNVICAAMQ